MSRVGAPHSDPEGDGVVVGRVQEVGEQEGRASVGGQEGRASVGGFRVQYLEKCIEFLKSQNEELVGCLHDEVDKLKRKNKGKDL